MSDRLVINRGFWENIVFFVKDQRHGATFLVFTAADPRKDGYKGDVEEDVDLDYDMLEVHKWPDGHARPEACVGRDPNNPKHYKVFKYSSELQSTGYQPVVGTLVTPGDWARYSRLHQIPPDPEQTEDEEWYEYLDKLDEDSRRRRQHAQSPDAPAGKSRDEVAAWAAKQHLFVDSGIREVWYLPEGAPADEIRFLELNDRFAANGSKVEAIGFGLDTDGARFRLFVADITSEQLEEIKRDPSRLPVGWSLDRNTIWRRRA
jgi:hypothetical protein